MLLATGIYKIFKDSHDYGFRDQFQRASVSIASDISEGYERQSNRQFIRFLYIAKGSCGELRAQIDLGIELELIDNGIGIEMLQKTKEISAMLYGLIRTRKRRF